jgi:hypothetical protein
MEQMPALSTLLPHVTHTGIHQFAGKQGSLRSAVAWRAALLREAIVTD